jgi:anti-sigma B factor antagonist
MTSLAQLTDERRGEIVIAGVTGEIDASNTRWLASRLRSLLTNRSDALAVDLTETTYIDSAGIALLFELGTELRQRQQVLHLVVAPGSPIARMITLTGLDTTLPTHDHRESIIDS